MIEPKEKKVQNLKTAGDQMKRNEKSRRKRVQKTKFESENY